MRLLTRMLVILRLVSPRSARAAPSRAARSSPAPAGQRSWEALLAAHEAARQSVSRLWQNGGEVR